MNEMLPPSLYVRYRDERDAVRKARQLLSTRSGLARAAALGAKARKHVIEHHNDRLRAAQVVSFLKAMLSI